MNKYLDRYYHIDKDGNLDFICLSIDCWEQMKYQALRNYNINFIDYNYIFCDNINLEFRINNENYSINKISNYLNKDLYSIKKYKENKNPLILIKEILDNGDFVALRTMFNTLPPYNWFYETPNIKHSNHFCSIIGYKLDEFYIGESQFLINQEYCKKYSRNKNITILNGKDLLNSLKCHSDIRTIRINSNYLNKINKLHYLLEIIIKDFYNDSKFIENKYNYKYIGKRALYEIKNTIEKNDKNIFEIDFFKSHFDAHIISSRHKLLYNCLKNDNEYSNMLDIDYILNKILEAAKIWENLKLIILKNTINPIKNFKRDIIICLDKIIETEKILFKCLLNII